MFQNDDEENIRQRNFVIQQNEILYEDAEEMKEERARSRESNWSPSESDPELEEARQYANAVE